MNVQNCSLFLVLSLSTGLLLYFFILRYINTGKEARFLSSLPVVGLEEGKFAWTKATFLSIFKTKAWAFEGYEKVGIPHRHGVSV